MADYLKMAKSDAWETCCEFLDEMIQQVDEDVISNDLFNDYFDGDSYHHESHVDKDYNLSEAAEVLRQLSDYEETDSGLWEGQQPRQAIATQAAFTYGAAVYCAWKDCVDNMNNTIDTHYESDRLKKLYITVHVRLNNITPDEGVEAGLVGALLEDAEKGDLSGVNIYCDWLEEFGRRERLMLELRKMCKKSYILNIEFDQDTENPCDYAGWKVVSFSRKHGNYEHPDNYISSVNRYNEISPKINVLSKLHNNLAFWLSYYEHGQCRWSFMGDGPQCQWDTTRIAGILIWQDKAADLPKERRVERACSFLDTYTRWCNGECYYYSIEDDEGNDVISCGGFIGADDLFSDMHKYTKDMDKDSIKVKGDAFLTNYHEIFP